MAEITEKKTKIYTIIGSIVSGLAFLLVVGGNLISTGKDSGMTNHQIATNTKNIEKLLNAKDSFGNRLSSIETSMTILHRNERNFK